MSGPFVTPENKALVYDRVTGEVHTWSVPTAVMNVERNAERYGHGAICPPGERVAAPKESRPASVAIPLREEGILDLPAVDDGQVDMLQGLVASLRAENAGLLARAENAEAALADLNASIDAAQGQDASGEPEALGGQGAEGEAEAPVPPSAPTPRPKAAARRPKPAARRKASATK